MRLAGCIKYATVVEVSSVDRAEEKIVCGSQSGGTSDRLSHVYTSRGNAVRLRLHVIASDDLASDAGSSPRFLVHYQGVFFDQSMNPPSLSLHPTRNVRRILVSGGGGLIPHPLSRYVLSIGRQRL